MVSLSTLLEIKESSQSLIYKEDQKQQCIAMEYSIHKNVLFNIFISNKITKEIYPADTSK